MNLDRTVALRFAWRCIIVASLSFGAFFGDNAYCGLTPLLSIRDISGPTIDFEGPGAAPNDVLAGFNMVETAGAGFFTLGPGIMGNINAPITNRTLFGAAVEIHTTGLAWNAIGLSSAASAPGQSRLLTIHAYDVNGAELGANTTSFFPPDGSITAFNSSVVFLGFSSTTPIGSIRLTSNNANTVWDDLRFSVVPEPSSEGLLALALAMISFCRQAKRHRQTP